ncbi:UNVERIFIED_CONTAM: Disease resistance protein RPP13 [Sesamum calycinum]|uniref:Disease resistance protein RPP13 n=1 Tax=Sesamum calycinum TaxID=2727403 RepID=A0AAW2NFW5_9LAMI
MATAYAALVSLMHIIEQIQHHPHPPVCLDKEQVQSLQENVAFLQDFLECYHRLISKEYEDGLVVRIADAAHATEDVIENHIVDQILDDQSTTTSRENISSIDHQFYQDLQKVIADMDLIKKQVIEIKEKIGIVQDPQLHGNSNPAGSLSSSTLQGHKQAMVGRDDVLNEIMHKLTRQQSDCRIIPIVGMGVSQNINTREILLELVCPKNKERKEALREIPDEGLGEMLYKTLCGRRYLIVMDDIWSIETWNNVKLFFPNNNSESRIMVTTSLSSRVRRSDLVDSLSFPNSLKKLTLRGCRLQWEEYTRKIGPLSLLQVLKLHKDSVIGSEWETVEGQFSRLGVLEITDIDDLEYLTADNSHFPCLHHLCLRHLHKLKKIPWGFGEIQTLELIELAMCSDSAVISVKEIAEQQEELGNEDLLVIVHLEPDSELAPELKSLASHRFRVF